MKTQRRVLALLVMVALACGLSLAVWGCAQSKGESASSSAAQEQSTSASGSASAAASAQAEAAALDFHNPGEGYKLEQVVVLSRHSIRAPLSTKDSALGKATPYEWIDWTANTGELTLRGGTLETMTGEYVRTWLESEGLIPENYRPAEGEVRFYANAKQRTIATAQYFSSGMLPVANVRIETHADYDKMDPVFTPAITFISDAYVDAALQQIGTMGGAKGMTDVAAGLADSYALIEDVVDYKDSEGYKSGELKDLDTTDTKVTLELGKEPALSGSLKTACQLADALVLQYYESPDAVAAAFGKNLTTEQWALISQSKDFYGDVLFTAPLVASNVAHPLLQEIGSELDTQGRVFTFLCGHDSNVGSVLAALGVDDYVLPGAIESKTPIGCKLVFERWTNAGGEAFGRVRLLYQSVDQLREGTMLAGAESPMSVEMSFSGMRKNADGLYAYSDLRARIADATAEYDRIVAEYGQQEQELPQAA